MATQTPTSTGPSCELLGQWHHWRTIEVVMDGSSDHAGPQQLDHAMRVMRCERCGAMSWRWTLPTERPALDTDQDGVRTVVHVPRPASRPAPA